MKKLILIASVVVLASALTAGAGSATLTLADRYVTRGIVCNDEPVLQTFLDLPFGESKWALELFENTALTDKMGTKYNVDELDVMPKYTISLSNGMDLVLGAAQYTFPNTEFDNTMEVYAKAVHSYFNVVYWYDVDAVDSWYGSVSFTPNVTMNSMFSMGAIGTIGYAGEGYNEFYFGTPQIAINDTTAGAWVSATMKSYIATLSISRTWLLSSAISNGAKEIYGKSDSSTVSLAITWMF